MAGRARGAPRGDQAGGAQKEGCGFPGFDLLRLFDGKCENVYLEVANEVAKTQRTRAMAGRYGSVMSKHKRGCCGEAARGGRHHAHRRHHGQLDIVLLNPRHGVGEPAGQRPRREACVEVFAAIPSGLQHAAAAINPRGATARRRRACIWPAAVAAGPRRRVRRGQHKLSPSAQCSAAISRPRTAAGMGKRLRRTLCGKPGKPAEAVHSQHLPCNGLQPPAGGHYILARVLLLVSRLRFKSVLRFKSALRTDNAMQVATCCPPPAAASPPIWVSTHHPFQPSCPPFGRPAGAPAPVQHMRRTPQIAACRRATPLAIGRPPTLLSAVPHTLVAHP